MTYKLLSTGKGVITTRQPKVLKDNATFLFNGAPAGAMAVFSMPSGSYYRPLTEGRCNIPAKYLNGDVAVAVTVADNSAKIKRYNCEGLVATKLSDGVLLAPNDSNLAEEFAKSRVELDDLRGDYNKLRQDLEDLRKTFNDMMQGYGLT